MDKYQFLEDSLKVYADFSGQDLRHLTQIGNFIGSNLAVFKKLYKCYVNKDTSHKIGSSIGKPALITFDWVNDEITIEKNSLEINFDSTLFLKYMNLIDISYNEILPVGSVIEADLEGFPEGFRKMYERNEEPALFILSGRKTPAHDINTPYYVDYVTRLFPFGETEFVPAFHLSNMMIKRIVHLGLTNDDEVRFTEKLSQDIVNSKVRSIGFLTEDEFKNLETMVANTMNTTLGGDS